MTGQTPHVLDDEVADALSEGRGVVALESTIISHGLPSESSAETGRRIEQEVRSAGAVPATIALIEGRVRIGLDDTALDQIATADDVVKASTRDLAVVLATGVLGATTVAATSLLASRAGIRVFATGGIGGVHLGAERTFDESADLLGLAGVPTAVVCAGVKSILDVPATLERLETLSVPVVGYRTSRFPGFYVRDSGQELPWRVEDATDIAAIMGMRDRLGLPQSLVVANPIAAENEMDQDLHDNTLAAGLEAIRRAGVRGKEVTPYLLAYFHDHTAGASLRANVDLVLDNARLAGAIASAWTRPAGQGTHA